MTSTYSNKRIARVAGLLYLIVVLTGIFSLAYVPNALFVWDDATLTFNNIMSSELLFRLSIVSSMVCYVAFLLLPIVLYRLLKPVNELYAKLMVLLATVSVPISFLNLQNKFSVLSLMVKEEHLKFFSNEELSNKVLVYLNQYDNGILIVSVFWGLWLLPFGYLVYKSGFLPKVLGIFLMLGCLGYLINFTGNTLFKDYAAFGISKFVSLPASIGEIGICLWLLIVGVKSKSALTERA
ncbi:MAG: DUF4386 domain-containing protein [Flavobacterium sp.]